MQDLTHHPTKAKKAKRSPAQHKRAQLAVAAAFAVIGSILLIKSFAATTGLAGDLNSDNAVNSADLSILFSHYGQSSATGDLNNDNLVNVYDMSMLLSNYGNTSPAPAPSPNPPPPAPNPSPTPNPTPPPPPPPSGPACGQAGGGCTAAQVAAHNSQQDCWVIYANKYFNITAFVDIHPGGQSVYNSTTCGHDVTEFLAGNKSSAGRTHKHSSNALNTLNSYYVGPVTP